MILKYLFIFSLFSFVGWILELFYRGIRQKKILNPGFVNGCVLPLYGFGAVICEIICISFEENNSEYNILWTFIIAIILLSILEFITGFILDKLFHMKLWDYSNYLLNIKGYICIQYSLMWGILFVVYYMFVHNNMDYISTIFINNNMCVFMLGIFYGVFFIDLSFSIGLTGNIMKYSKIIAESINIEKLRLDLKKQVERKKFVHSMFPYVITNKYLKDKIKEK